jgi:hypothetical protein
MVALGTEVDVELEVSILYQAKTQLGSPHLVVPILASEHKPSASQGCARVGAISIWTSRDVTPALPR